jgi:hypothetical protein
VRRLPLLGLLTLPAVFASASAWAATDPYPTGHIGYDISYPQCPPKSTAGDFGIIGVNDGRPFMQNPCLAGEVSLAPTTTLPSLYINAAYSIAYRKQITQGCSTSSASITGTSAQKQAWAIGCSEAETSISYSGAPNIAMWWLDVETGNSWSTSNLALNQYAINGAASRLEQSGLPVGVYSTGAMWTTITGGNKFTPTNIAADWEASGGSCTAAFTNSPVWLLQSVKSGLDTDYAC